MLYEVITEVDALGGAMARAIDRAGIHFRTLNARKGPAVRATRAQADRTLYKRAIRQILETAPNLKLLQQSVEDRITSYNVCYTKLLRTKRGCAACNPVRPAVR